MSSPAPEDAELFEGLQALTASTFPKKCTNCGVVYACKEDFWLKTDPMQGRTGFTESRDDDGHPIVELFRNCPCGSTLMVCFNNRRDTSANGLKRRMIFDRLLTLLEARGVPSATARAELLKMMRGRPSPMLDRMGIAVDIR